MANSTTPKLRRRITLILDTAGPRRPLLEMLPFLFPEGVEIDLDAILLEDETQRRAAELPFVRELSLLTTSEREFGTAQFQRAIALCRQGLEQALRSAARRDDVALTVRCVGAAVGRLQEFALASDITLFGPPRRFGQELLPVAVRARRRGRIVVVIDDLSTGSRALAVAGQLAGGDTSRLSVIVGVGAGEGPSAADISAAIALPPASIRRLTDAGIDALLKLLHDEGAAAAVLGVNAQALSANALEILRRRLRCPVCLVRIADR
jgi:hypothetical protein